MVKKPKSRKKSLPAKTKPRKSRVSYNPSMLQTVENIIFDTGRVEDCHKALNVHRSTFYRWIERYSELSDVVARARIAHQKVKERAFQGEMIKALDGLGKLLSGHVVTLRDESTEEIRDEETGKVLETLKVVVRMKETYIRPDMRAIEKVLGPNDLRHNVYLKAFEDHVINHDDELYKLVFGSLLDGVNGEMENFAGTRVLAIQLDLLKTRYMEAHIQKLYDDCDITVAQYMDYTAKLRRDFGSITDRMELRAQKLFEGASYQDILHQYIELWRVLIETVGEEVRKPITIKDKEFRIPPEFANQLMENIVKRVNERNNKDTYFTKLVSISE